MTDAGAMFLLLGTPHFLFRALATVVGEAGRYLQIPEAESEAFCSHWSTLYISHDYRTHPTYERTLGVFSLKSNA